METRNHIIETLRATGRENIENVINYMDSHGYFTASCHKHHRYDGGMADHAWQTYRFAKKIAEAVQACSTSLSINPDSIAICALLHDFCDCHGMHHHAGHGQRSAAMLKELGLHLSAEEFLAIRFHMRLCTHEDHPLYQDAKRCKLRTIIHTSDNLSSSLGGFCNSKNPQKADASIRSTNRIGYNREFTPETITQLHEGEIFVFGSNIYGNHGGGAAAIANVKFGAVWGVGEGLTGQSYALPTMEGGVDYIGVKVQNFLACAREHPELKFYVTRIACGIAGFTPSEIAPLFKDALAMDNVILPKDFVEILLRI